MTDLAEVDYFTDADIAQDPYAYWDFLRSHGPVFREPHYGVVTVTGYREVQAAFKDVESFSAVNAIGGPFPPLPFTPEGDDITDQIEAHRHEFPIFEHMVVMDPPEHDKALSLLGRLLTPRRLQENKDAPRPDTRHRDQRGQARPGRRPSIRLRTDLLAAGADRVAHRVHPGGYATPVTRLQEKC